MYDTFKTQDIPDIIYHLLKSNTNRWVFRFYLKELSVFAALQWSKFVPDKGSIVTKN